MNWRDEFDRLHTMIEERLSDFFEEQCAQKPLLEAMRYSLMAGGKRIRPVLVLKFCDAAGGDIEKAVPFACAIEMIHTYSLIHDDLPAMDNDDLRRGRPTCHKAYGECRAILAGDALQAAAFRTLFSAKLPDSYMVAAGRNLADAAGERGMCGGQELDTSDYVQRDEEGLGLINDLKTGALLRAACVLGILAAGDAGSDIQLRAAEEYGLHLARAFQIRDDVLDVVSDPMILGKPTGSDAENNKPTYASVYGLERCRTLILEETEKAVSAISRRFKEWEFFSWLANSLAERKS